MNKINNFSLLQPEGEYDYFTLDENAINDLSLQYLIENIVDEPKEYENFRNILIKMPVDEKVQKLFMEASAEALTNAISHAGAKTLVIILTETESSYSITFKNDGIKPTEPVVEGGGLTNLRRKVEEQFGTMEISVEPEFQLRIVVRK